MTTIPVLTEQELDNIGRVANAPGRLVKCWSQLTRVVRDRLMTAHQIRRGAPRSRVYRDANHYLELSVTPQGALLIEFGQFAHGDVRQRRGRLAARWDELGLTGPYDVTLRDSEHTLNTFCAVLEHYLTLPEPS